MIFLTFSIGLGNNKKYSIGLLFESSFSYELEFKPINLSFELGYTKFVNITDEYRLDFDCFDLIGFNIKLIKNIQFD